LPKTIDEGIDSVGKREWLEQVIGSTIEPRVQDVLIKQIDLKKSPGKAIFVVQVPVGITAHQAYDRRYYRRFNFSSVPMHDYEVRMVMDRLKQPFIDLTIDLGHIIEDHFSLEIVAKNSGLISAQSAQFRVGIPRTINSTALGSAWYCDPLAAWGAIEVTLWMINCGSMSRLEFFPGLELPLSSKSGPNTLRLRLSGVLEVPIFYEIYATNMKPKSGKFAIKGGSGVYEISREQAV
jgi:hypothetical protein